MWPPRARPLLAALCFAFPCASLRTAGHVVAGTAAGESAATVDAGELGVANASAAKHGNSTADGKRNLQVVVMLMMAPDAREWRQMVRSHWGEVSRGVRALGRDVDLVMRFAVGKANSVRAFGMNFQAPNLLADMLVESEAAKYGDMAILDVKDGAREHHSKAQHGGKIWHVFKWALDHYPEADLYFKQDDDNIVNWRIALPTMLASASRERVAAARFERLYMGRLQFEFDDPCGMGELYGFSRDLLEFGLAFFKPEQEAESEESEDVFTCNWVRGLEQIIGEGAVDKGGLLRWPQYENAWIHPVKDKAVYESCVRDVAAGCVVEYAWGDHQNITFRMLPDVEAARDWLAHNSTAQWETKL